MNQPGAPNNAEELNAHLSAIDKIIESEPSTDDGEGMSLHAPVHADTIQAKHSWLSKLIPGIHALLVKEKFANEVAICRGPNPKTQFESMPIYVRLGMHILYCGKEQEKLLGEGYLKEKLKKQSIATGLKYDDPTNPLPHIQEFIKTYSIDCSDLAKPNPSDYISFNDFFSRALKPGARPIAEPENQKLISSVADCRLTVYTTIAEAQKFWIKGKKFSIPNLLDHDNIAEKFVGGSIAIFRLAPADYHRWHVPVDANIGPVTTCGDSYFTVNPAAINEDLDVFTSNKRNITLLSHSLGPGNEPINLALVAVGAMLVGSIIELKSQGDVAKRGEEMGYFAYGGSTVILILPPGSTKFDEDLIINSKNGIETAVRVGDRIGVLV